MSSNSAWPTDFFGSFPQGAYLPYAGATSDCNAVVEDGGEGIAVCTLGATDYPLVKPSADVRHLLADACLTLPSSPIYQHPLRIVWLSGFDAYFGSCASTELPPTPPAEYGGNVRAFDPTLVLPTYTQRNGADVVIYDAANQVVFDSTTVTQYVTSAYGPRLRVHQWTAANAVLRVTQHTAFPSIPMAYVVPHVITPARAVLDERVADYQPVCLTGFTIDDNPTVFSGALKIVPGYNTNTSPGTTATTPSITRSGSLLLSALLNSGLGRAPATCDNETIPITSIGQVAPSAYGSFVLSGDPCYWVRPVVTLAGNKATIIPNRFQIGNDCGPCCDCPDYVATALGIQNVFSQFQAVGAQAETTRDSFAAGLLRWSNVAGLQAPYLVQSRFLVNHTQYLDGVLQICNSSQNCLREFQMTVNLTLLQTGVSPSTIKYLLVPTTSYISNLCNDMLPCPVSNIGATYSGSLDPGYVQLNSTDSSGNPTQWVVQFYQIQPRSFARFRFRLQFVGLNLATPTTLIFSTILGGPSPYSQTFPVQIV